MKSKWDDLEYLRRHLDRALEDLYRHYRPAFLRWHGQEWPSMDMDERMDIFQDAVILVWKNVHTGRLSTLTCSLWTYVCAIAKKLTWAHLKKRKRFSYVDDMFDYLKSTGVFSEIDYPDRQEMEVIWQFIDRMEEPYCSVLTLTLKFGLSAGEIAEMLNAASAGVVRVQRTRGLERLRGLLKTQKM